MSKIREAQYKNLKKCLSKNLIQPILGDDYYNMGLDTYTCDEMIAEDLKIEYDKRNKKIKNLKILLFISVYINIIFIIIIYKLCSILT